MKPTKPVIKASFDFSVLKLIYDRLFKRLV